MKKLTLLFLALICLSARASTVIFNLTDWNLNYSRILTNSIKVWQTTNVIGIGGLQIGPILWLNTTNGLATNNIASGTYAMQVLNGVYPAYPEIPFTFNVPNDTNTYTFTELATNLPYANSNAVPYVVTNETRPLILYNATFPNGLAANMISNLSGAPWLWETNYNQSTEVEAMWNTFWGTGIKIFNNAINIDGNIAGNGTQNDLPNQTLVDTNSILTAILGAQLFAPINGSTAPITNITAGAGLSASTNAPTSTVTVTTNGGQIATNFLPPNLAAVAANNGANLNGVQPTNATLTYLGLYLTNSIAYTIQLNALSNNLPAANLSGIVPIANGGTANPTGMSQGLTNTSVAALGYGPIYPTNINSVQYVYFGTTTQNQSNQAVNQAWVLLTPGIGSTGIYIPLQSTNGNSGYPIGVWPNGQTNQVVDPYAIELYAGHMNSRNINDGAVGLFANGEPMAFGSINVSGSEQDWLYVSNNIAHFGYQTNVSYDPYSNSFANDLFIVDAGQNRRSVIITNAVSFGVSAGNFSVDINGNLQLPGAAAAINAPRAQATFTNLSLNELSGSGQSDFISYLTLNNIRYDGNPAHLTSFYMGVRNNAAQSWYFGNVNTVIYQFDSVNGIAVLSSLPIKDAFETVSNILTVSNETALTVTVTNALLLPTNAPTSGFTNVLPQVTNGMAAILNSNGTIYHVTSQPGVIGVAFTNNYIDTNGVQYGNGGGLTNLTTTNMTGTIGAAQITNSSFATTLAPTFSAANLTGIPPVTNFAAMSATTGTFSNFVYATNITSPAATQIATTVAGSNIYISASSAVVGSGTTASASSNGGSIYITAGNGSNYNAGNGTGGNVNITGGNISGYPAVNTGGVIISGGVQAGSAIGANVITVSNSYPINANTGISIVSGGGSASGVTLGSILIQVGTVTGNSTTVGALNLVGAGNTESFSQGGNAGPINLKTQSGANGGTGFVGGNGGQLNITLGAGGAVNSGTTSTGGNGGSLSFSGGNGGSNPNTSGFGGNGSPLTFTSGAGGNAAGATATGGNSGTITFATGVNGTGTTNGLIGTINFAPGGTNQVTIGTNGLAASAGTFTNTLTASNVVATTGFTTYNTNQFTIQGTGLTNLQTYNLVAYPTATAVAITYGDGTNTIGTYTISTGSSFVLHPSWKITAAAGLGGVAIAQ